MPGPARDRRSELPGQQGLHLSRAGLGSGGTQAPRRQRPGCASKAQAFFEGPPGEVAVEESVWGVASSMSAGLTVVAVTTSYPAGAFADAALVVPSLAALTLDALRGLPAR